MIKFPAAKLVMSPDITDDYSNLNKDYFQPSRKNLFRLGILEMFLEIFPRLQRIKNNRLFSPEVLL